MKETDDSLSIIELTQKLTSLMEDKIHSFKSKKFRRKVSIAPPIEAFETESSLDNPRKETVYDTKK